MSRNELIRIGQNLNWIHGNIEDPPAEWKEKFDWVSCSFMFHELPKDATERILNQLASIVKKGGVIALSDNNPRSPVIQNLPAPIFTLMKATEPWTDEYYVFNFENYLERLGLGAAARLASSVPLPGFETEPSGLWGCAAEVSQHLAGPGHDAAAMGSWAAAG